MNTSLNCKTAWESPWAVPPEKILTPEEIASITQVNYRAREAAIAMAHHRKTPVIDWMIWNTSLWGLRICESSHLECGQIHAQTNPPYLDLQYTKGKKPRIVIIDEIFAFHLHEHLQWKESIGESIAIKMPFFYSHTTKTFMSTGGLRKAFKRAVRKAGIQKNITPHAGRHNLGTYMAQGEVQLRVLQKTLGHASIATTQVYLHALTEHYQDFARQWGNCMYQKIKK